MNAITDAKAYNSFEVDGLTPRAVESPTTSDELARVVANAAKENFAITPWGGGTHQHLGGVPRRYDLAIQTTRLNHVVEYAPDDLTITVESGITLANLQAHLAEHNQFLPLDPPLADRATIGGILATNSSGPLRLRYGPPRDFTLGMRFVNVEGEIIKSGGKVVKNVAGYELYKLLIGSLGTLGIIAQISFKVSPKPLERIMLLATFHDYPSACRAIRAIWNLTTAPLAIELLDSKLARTLDVIVGENDFLVIAQFGGSRVTLDAAKAKAFDAAHSDGAASVDFLSDTWLWQRVVDMPATLRAAHPLGCVLRIGLPPAQLSAAIEKLYERVQVIGIESMQFFAHAAIAIMYAGIDGDIGQMIESIKHFRWALAPLHAHVIVESAPREVKEKIEVWGAPGPEHVLAQRLKGKFDPQMILNSGRFIGGL